MGHTHGQKWDDQLIEESIKNVVTKLNIDHFPTHKEMLEATGNRGLACAISKRQGSNWWAERLGLKVRYNETSFGNRYEVICINDIFEKTELHSVQTSSGHPYDLLTDNSVKIDVKVSKPFVNNSNAESYAFHLEKREPTCDIFVLYCVSNDEIIHKTLVIPSCSLLGQTQLGIGVKSSKWDIYKDDWITIKEYADFYRRYIYGKKAS